MSHDVQISMKEAESENSHEVKLKIDKIELKPNGSERRIMGEVDSIFLRKNFKITGVQVTSTESAPLPKLETS